MPTFTVPGSYGTVREFNPCHAPEDGKFCATEGGRRFPGYGRPDRTTVSEPGFVYHATNEEAVEGIARRGIRGRRPWFGTDQRVWPDGRTERRVYFTANAGIAWTFAPEHGQPVLLRVRDAKVPTRRESTGDRYATATVKPGFVEVLGQDGRWYPLWKTAKRKFREFNPCHSPVDGKFCSDPAAGAWTAATQRVTKARRATTSAMRPATAAERRRLAIPPAYRNAMVAVDKKAEQRATATTPAGKTAYYYSPSYAQRQQAAKWSRVVAFQKDAPALYARLDKDIAKGGEARHTAMTLRLIMQTGMRNGIEADGTYGATSLRLDHVTTDGDLIRFQFPGKGGKAQDVDVRDPVLARYVEDRRRQGAEKLFPHEAADTLSYLKTVGRGRDYKVHDLRTWYATVYADHLTRTLISEGHRPRNTKEAKAFRKAVATQVSARLGNTPAIALKTYIHPVVFSGARN